MVMKYNISHEKVFNDFIYKSVALEMHCFFFLTGKFQAW